MEISHQPGFELRPWRNHCHPLSQMQKGNEKEQRLSGGIYNWWGRRATMANLEPHVQDGRERWILGGFKAIFLLEAHVRAFVPLYQPSTWASMR